MKQSYLKSHRTQQQSSSDLDFSLQIQSVTQGLLHGGHATVYANVFSLAVGIGYCKGMSSAATTQLTGGGSSLGQPQSTNHLQLYRNTSKSKIKAGINVQIKADT